MYKPLSPKSRAIHLILIELLRCYLLNLITTCFGERSNGVVEYMRVFLHELFSEGDWRVHGPLAAQLAQPLHGDTEIREEGILVSGVSLKVREEDGVVVKRMVGGQPQQVVPLLLVLQLVVAVVKSRKRLGGGGQNKEPSIFTRKNHVHITLPPSFLLSLPLSIV